MDISERDMLLPVAILRPTDRTTLMQKRVFGKKTSAQCLFKFRAGLAKTTVLGLVCLPARRLRNTLAGNAGLVEFLFQGACEVGSRMLFR